MEIKNWQIQKPIVVVYPKTDKSIDKVNNCTQELMRTVRVGRKEMLEALFFDNVEFDRKLNEYWHTVCLYMNRNPKNDKEQVEKDFWCYCINHYLDDACFTHTPQIICKDKNLYLTMSKIDYIMHAKRIVDGKDEVVTDLSEQDRTIFQYLCYLQVNKFWRKVNQSFGEKEASPLPLVITDFLEKLDENAPVDELLSQATAMGKQVFVFTKHTPNFKKLEKMPSVQFIEIE